MRALDSPVGENIMKRCLGSSGVGQKLPVEIQHAQEAAELTGSLGRGAEKIPPTTSSLLPD
jgi:hypothetical protein